LNEELRSIATSLIICGGKNRGINELIYIYLSLAENEKKKKKKEDVIKGKIIILKHESSHK